MAEGFDAFTERARKALQYAQDEAAVNTSTLLCIPEIGGLPREAFALLARMLSGDDTRILGITTSAGFEHIAVDAASVADHCHAVLVEEPTLAESLDILRAASPALS